MARLLALKLWSLATLSAQLCIGAIVESFADLPTVDYDFIVVGGMPSRLRVFQI
jgi:hypothetical protein